VAHSLEQASLEFAALAQRLRYADDRGLRDELNQKVSDATGPVIREMRAELKPLLPDRYAATLDEDLELSVSKRTAGSQPGVRITGRTRSRRARKLRYVDEGRLTHPVFGDRTRWFTQEAPSVRPGWFTGPALRSAPRMRDAILAAMADVKQKIERG
jgi:hypothetical protein